MAIAGKGAGRGDEDDRIVRDRVWPWLDGHCMELLLELARTGLNKVKVAVEVDVHVTAEQLRSNLMLGLAFTILIKIRRVLHLKSPCTNTFQHSRQQRPTARKSPQLA